MPILDRYLFKDLVFTYIVCLAAFMTLIGTFAWIDHLHRFNFPWLTVWSFFKYVLVEYLVLMMVVSLFLACLITYSNLSKNLELIAMSASGISTLRLFSPAISLAFAVSTLHLVINDRYAIPSKIKYDQAKEKAYHPEYSPNYDPVTYRLSNIWIRHNDSFLNFQSASPDGKSISGVSIYQTAPTGLMKTAIFGNDAHLTDTGWRLKKVKNVTFTEPQGIPIVKKLKETPIDYQASADQVKAVIPTPAGMPLAALRKFIELNKERGSDFTKLNVEFHYRIAFSFSCLIFTLLALPFCTKSARNSNLAVNIGICFLFITFYWFLFQFLRSLGTSQGLHPLISAWGANLLFGSGALFLLYTRGTIR